MPPLAINVSDILRPGVYLLYHSGRVTYVGKAKCILAALTNHVIRNRTRLPLWAPIPVIHFDAIEIIPCDTHRAIALQASLITIHSPTHNRPAREAPGTATILPPQRPSTPTTVRRL